MPESFAGRHRRAVCDDARLLASADPATIDAYTDRADRAAPPSREEPSPPAAAARRAAAPPSANADLAALRLASQSRRDFVAADGTQWCVHERDAGGMAHARGARCLVFETGNVLRVVWNYPRDWRTLDDAALEALSRSR